MTGTKLFESLFILYKCNKTINRLWPVINERQDHMDPIQEIKIILSNHIKMECVSFLDEFNGAFLDDIEEQYKPRMMEVRQITAPIIRRIRKWTDLEKFRNNIIAHPWRNKGEFAIPDSQFYNVPRSWFEVALLVNLMNYLWSSSVLNMKILVL